VSVYLGATERKKQKRISFREKNRRVIAERGGGKKEGGHRGEDSSLFRPSCVGKEMAEEKDLLRTYTRKLACLNGE